MKLLINYLINLNHLIKKIQMVNKNQVHNQLQIKCYYNNKSKPYMIHLDLYNLNMELYKFQNNQMMLIKNINK